MLVAIEVNRGAIFRNVEHALHTAFLVIANEPRQGCVTRSMLLQMMATHQEVDARLPALTPAQAEWFIALKGSPSGTIDFSGLTDDEVRAQCALIVSAVKSKLPEAEMNVVLARYGATDYEDVDGRRRYAFSRERGDAIRALADWMRPMVANVPSMAVDVLLARQFANHVKTKISVRDLAASFGCSKSTFHRASGVVRDHVRQLEALARERLYPYFVEQGVIPPSKASSAAKKID
ncbi:MAG: hypothetical protein GAK35_02764 [Herbaspirillum frisingense]|uniref:Uncharacterized protein n=1 Tax=Herbaspirillum frisingense TaxID=92645 RepID=A0A7V8FVI1_9BURK|nr:MAG: hypothetical protein GAK35_02764 [Herbaspirillum frisingense]